MGFARGAAPDSNAAAIRIDGRAYLLDPATPDLLDALAEGRLLAIFPGAVADPAARNHLFGRLFSYRDPLDTPGAERIASAYLKHVTGWDLPAAVRLAAALAHSWALLDGQATAEGVDLLALPVRRALNWVYSRAVEGAEYDEQDHPGARLRLERDLRAPLPDALPAAPRPRRAPATPDPAVPAGFSRAEQAAAFRSAMSALGAPGT